MPNRRRPTPFRHRPMVRRRLRPGRGRSRAQRARPGRLGPLHPVHHPAPGMPRRHLDRRELVRRVGRRRPLLRADGGRDRRLPPLFLAQDLQHVAARCSSSSRSAAARPSSAGRSGGPTTTATTTSTPTRPEDAHSPHVHGFWWSHIGWITSRRNFPTDYSKVRDLDRYPELVFLNRFDAVVPARVRRSRSSASARSSQRPRPGLHTSGWQMLVWGFFISTTALFHGTSCINSMAHLMGRRRYQTERRLAQQLHPGDRHARRGLAQQPPPLPERDPQRLLLVGDRHHLLPAQGASRGPASSGA